MVSISFTDLSMCIKEEYYPSPSEKDIPEWYVKTNNYINDEKLLLESTIKKCMPVFDVMSAGYLLKFPMDIEVISMGENKIITTMQNNLEFFHLSHHIVEQAPHHPLKKNQSYFKINNPWSIKTEPGYSCLFLNPIHRNSNITIMEGIVDTDKYTYPVNLPFVVKDEFEGIIKAGTPFAQVIPFKREEFNMTISPIKKEESEIKEVSNLLEKAQKENTLNLYKTLWRSRKSYK
jgi:hypothetical protein